MTHPAERPACFTDRMVLAIERDLKSQTRRVIVPQPLYVHKMPPTGLNVKRSDFIIGPDMLPTTGNPGLIIAKCLSLGNYDCMGSARFIEERSRLGIPGDLLWVKQCFALQDSVADEAPPHDDGRPILRYTLPDGERMWRQAHYRATDPPADLTCRSPRCRCCRDGEPGPHWRSSRFMPRWASRTTLEILSVRVQRVQDISEDDARAEGFDSRAEFLAYWDKLHAKRGYGVDVNPWVFAYEFRRVTK